LGNKDILGVQSLSCSGLLALSGPEIGRRVWNKIARQYEELKYEEEHGHPRPKTLLDRLLDKREDDLRF